MYFNRNEFLKNYQAAVAELDNVDTIAAKLAKLKISNVYFTGCGGAYTKFVDLRPLIFKELNIPFMIVSPEELVSTYLDKVSEHSLIIAGTKTGETAELITSLEKLRTAVPACTIVSFIGDADSTLEQKHVIDYRIHSIDTDVNLIEMGWLLLELSGKSDKEKRAQVVKAGEQIAQGIEALIPASLNKVNDTDIHDTHMWVGSGYLWGEVCCFANYLMEEIQRIKAQAVHSGEFFHGPFEVVDGKQSVSIVVNSSINRKQDLRVVDFVKNFVKDPLIVDMATFDFDNLADDVKAFVEPYALNHYFDTLYNMYSVKTGRSAATRRYYRLLEY